MEGMGDVRQRDGIPGKMDDASFVQWLIGQAGVSGLAGFALWMLRQSYQSQYRREQEYARENRDDKKLLMELLSENSRVMSALKTLLESYIRQERGDTKTRI